MIRVLTTYFNNPVYITKTVKSLQMQKYSNWMCYITNDCSTDGSEKIVENLIADDKRFVFINNTKKMWQCGNYYHVVHRPEIQDGEICVTVDGDDWLPDDEVFSRIISYYIDGKTWMTFGQFEYYEGPDKSKPGFTKKPIPFSNARALPWTSSHLRTFKAGLFRRVNINDLINPNTKGFLEMAGDVACFSPCLEMAGEDRVKYVDDVNYIYNVETPMNEAKIDIKYSTNCADFVAKLKRYSRL